MGRLRRGSTRYWPANLPALATSDGSMKPFFISYFPSVCHHCHYFPKSRREKRLRGNRKTSLKVVAMVASPSPLIQEVLRKHILSPAFSLGVLQ